ncbi:MAG: hypothetical protein OXG72_19665, partial [Acidobacteria bacterium]|nr:hypothetical protein [Acidobacteriota bacterium]
MCPLARASAWRRRLSLSSSPSDSSSSAGRSLSPRRRGRPASPSDSLEPSSRCTAAGVRLAARRLRRGLLALLFALPLLAVFSTGAQAQVECTSANADGSYTVPGNWALRPSGLTAGARFRLLFLTNGRRDATSTDIADYNSFVQSSAKGGHSAITDSCGDLFKVVGSTSTVDARVNTLTRSTDTAASIYWLNGDKLADDYADFYDGTWDSYSKRFETGVAGPSEVGIFTGSNADGTRHTTQYLGSSDRIRAGVVVSSSINPINYEHLSRTGTQRFAALSPVFAVEGVVPTASNPAVSVGLPSIEGLEKDDENRQVYLENLASTGMSFN